MIVLGMRHIDFSDLTDARDKSGMVRVERGNLLDLLREVARCVDLDRALSVCHGQVITGFDPANKVDSFTLDQHPRCSFKLNTKSSRVHACIVMWQRLATV